LATLAMAVCLVAFLAPLIGCRTIRKIGDERQALAARRLSRQGMQAMRRGRWEDAEGLFSQALNLSAADDRAHRGLSEAYWKRGQRQQAIHHLEQAVEMSAGDPRLICRLGEMYLAVDRLADANRQCERALAVERDSADIWLLRGQCLQAEGQDEAALAAYHRALALQPDLVEAKLQAAELYFRHNRYDRLLATLDQIDPSGQPSRLDPTRVHLLRGIAMRNLGRPQLAAKHFHKAAASAPSRAEPHLQLAAIELELGRPESAGHFIQQALQRDPELVRSSGWSDVLLSPGQRVAAESASEPADVR
jgi:tetratricopeptide (TPR) repeat protein